MSYLCDKEPKINDSLEKSKRELEYIVLKDMESHDGH
jgi:hypothetical protein